MLFYKGRVNCYEEDRFLFGREDRGSNTALVAARLLRDMSPLRFPSLFQ